MVSGIVSNRRSSRGRGGRPLETGTLQVQKLSFESRELVPPAEVVLDTSFVVHALVSGEPHHAAARSFLAHLAEARCIIVFNRGLELELRETAFRLPADRALRPTLEARACPPARRRCDTVWEELLEAFRYLPVEVGEILDRLDDLYTNASRRTVPADAAKGSRRAERPRA